VAFHNKQTNKERSHWDPLQNNTSASFWFALVKVFSLCLLLKVTEMARIDPQDELQRCWQKNTGFTLHSDRQNGRDVQRTRTDQSVQWEVVPLPPCRREGGEKIQLLLILDLDAGWGWVVSVTLYPGKGPHSSSWIGCCVGLGGGLGTGTREEILCLCRGSYLGRPVCSQTLCGSYE
jgi:hypothetical protein